MSTARFVSYAQNLEDVMLWRALHEAVPDGGFYVDVGASDPTLLSVTRAFYDRGWRGVDIEPLPDQAATLRRARPRDVVIQAAVADAPGERTFHRVTMLRQTGLSTFDAAEAARHAAAGAEVEAIQTRVTTLAEVWRAHVDGPVHFLKIDAEGAEAEVLAGADFTVMHPWIIVLEATGPMSEAAAAIPWEPGLLAAGYRFVWFDGLNRFYLADEHADLARHFRVQPNIFDAYHQYDAPLLDHVAAIEAMAHASDAALQALRAERAPPGPQGAPVPPAATPAPAASSPRGVLRRLALMLYRPVRPMIRPLVWRARGFLIGPLLQETAELRQQLAELQARPLPNPRPMLDPAVSASLDRMMLTLALDAARAPPEKDGLSNPGTGG